MDVNEVVDLANWLDDHVQPAMSTYEQLAAAMEQNANNGGKVPIRDHLELVEEVLRAMPIERLSLQQMEMLAALNAAELLGVKGWRYVEGAVKEGNFDPASAASDVRKAKQTIDNVLAQMQGAKNALVAVGVSGAPEFDSSESVTVRIRFKDAVEIANVAQLKNRTSDWYEISRGLAMAADEKPEEIKVKGATTGSLIIILGTSLTVATIIALIMKQLASTMKSSMEIAHTLQDWKMRKIADDEVERVLKARKKSVEEKGASDALQLVKDKIGKLIAGEVENSLKKSIEKMFSFSAKGGEVDMLPPPRPNEDEEIEEDVADAINSIADSVEEMRTLNRETQLLIEDGSGEEE